MRQWPLGLFLLLASCATESTTPAVSHYLVAGPAAHFPNQVEVLKGSLIQVRSGDFLLEAQSQTIEDAVGVQFYVINLSEHPARLEAKDFSLVDAKGVASRVLKIKEVFEPVRERAARMDMAAKDGSGMVRAADSVVNPGEDNGSSTNKRMAKDLRGEVDRLENSLQKPFVSAVLPVNTKVGGTVYFSHPANWPVELKVQINEDTLAASFYNAALNP